MSKVLRALSLLTAFALMLTTLVPLATTTAGAQTTTGILTGVVNDVGGGAVVGARVIARNQATGVETATTTTGEGVYRFSNLPPGHYTVTVEGAGFKRSVTTDVDVKVGTENPLNPVLQPGEVTETVTVVAGGEEIAQTTSQISSSFETRKVEELPSNAAGSGLDTLALLAPGVVPGNGGTNTNGTGLSVNGNRPRSNNFTLDGTDNNDLTVGGPNFFISNQDSVAEFQVITNNYSAQFGRNQGAVVNIVTKSGTNEFHGSGFEYHRNSSALDAMTNTQRRDPTRSRRDKFISNVFGGTFGGPIVKNKAFFFVDGQLIRQREQFAFGAGNPAIIREDLPVLAAAFPGNPVIQAIANQNVFAIQPTARAQADAPTGTLCFPRDPTMACTGANAVVVRTAFPEYDLPLPFDQKEYGLRGDFTLTERDTFNVKYRYQQSPETGFVSQSNGFFGDIPFKSRNLNGQYTRQVGTRGVNELRVAWQKLGVTFGGCGTTDDPLAGCIPDSDQIGNAFTNITFNGITSSGVTMQSIGPATNVPQGREVRVFQLSDTFSWTAGRHSMIFGFDYRNLNNSVPFLPNFNGAFRFNNLARVVANAPLFVTLGAGEPTISYKENDQYYYFQDDWKVRDNLTLNLGLRYEYTGQPVNTLHELTLARESDPASALWRQSLPIEARTFPRIPADKNNFAPRLGFAWSPRWGGDGGFSRMLFGEADATVIRGGFSIAYEPAFYNILLNVSTSAPTVFLNTINNRADDPTTALREDLLMPNFRLPTDPIGESVRSALSSFLQRNTFDPRLLSQTTVGEDFHAPYSKQWSLGIQRQVNRNNVFELRYVGNAGVGLFQTVNRNPSIANLFNGFTSAGFGGTTFTFPSFSRLIPAGITPLVCTDVTGTPDNEGACNGRILPGRGLIRSRENTGSSSYHSMQARYNGRLFNQLTLGLAYTWSKAIDNASEIFDFGGNSPFAANPFDLTDGERGLSAFDRRHAHSANFLWDIPFYKSQEGFAGHVLGGWQINGTYILASGRPFTPSQFFNIFGAPTYQDATIAAGFVGYDMIRPFYGSADAPRDAVGISDIDASYFGFTGEFIPSPTGLYSLNSLNTTGDLVPVSANDVRFILNGPGQAARAGNPFGNVLRNSERGPALNQLNIGIFKNTNVTERVKVQFRAELFNALNHPNPGYGVAAESSQPDTFIEDASLPGALFNDKREMTLSSRRIQLGIRIIF